MLTPQALERVSQAYRRGYRDGYNGTNVKPEYDSSTFAEYDYKQGVEAGENDKKGDDRNAKAHTAKMQEHNKMLNEYLENLRALNALDGDQLNDALAYITENGATSKHRIKLNAIALTHGYTYFEAIKKYVDNIEPFVGSLAVLLTHPNPAQSH